MLLEYLLDITIDLLEHPEFKSFGDLEKSRYQHEKMTDEEREIRSLMYKGQKGDSEAVKRGHETRKKRATYEEEIKAAANKRAEWYKNPENMKKYRESLKKRKHK